MHATSGDGLLAVVNEGPGGDDVHIFSASFCGPSQRSAIEANLLSAVTLPAASMVASKLRTASLHPFVESSNPHAALLAPSSSGYAGATQQLWRFARVSKDVIKPASGITVALDYATGQQNAQLLQLLQPQLPFLLDGVILSVGCTIPIQFAGKTVKLVLKRASPANSFLIRVGQEHTRITVDDGTTTAEPAAQPTSSPLKAAALHSPWKSPKPGRDSDNHMITSTSYSPTATGTPAKAQATVGGSSTAQPGSPAAPWKTPLKGKIDLSDSTPTRSLSKPLDASHEKKFSPAAATAEQTQRIGDNNQQQPEPVPIELSVAGLDAAYACLHEMVIMPFTPKGSELLSKLRLAPPTGALLFGPPGTGKTQLVRSIAAAAQREVPGLRVKLFYVAGPEILSPVVGEPERRLRSLFDDARFFAAGGAGKDKRSDPRQQQQQQQQASSPTAAAALAPGLSIICLDEVDSLCPKRAVQGGRVGTSSGSAVAARVTTQLLTLMDGVKAKGSSDVSTDISAEGTGLGENAGRVVVVAATNRPDALDPALRRPGRLDREIRIHPPDAGARAAILRLHASKLPLSQELQADGGALLASLAESAVGFVGADLAAVCREAAGLAVERRLSAALALAASSADALTSADASPTAASPSSPPPPPDVTASDITAAMARVGASCLRGVALTAPRTRWEDIGGMSGAIARLREAVEQPLTHAPVYRRMGLSVPRGILLYGPPGNAKTTLVRALATSVRASFLSLSGADVYSPYVGEAERILREAFALARSALPCVVFLDEIDALVGSRGIGGGSSGSSTHDVSTGVLATLLTEMDGVAAADGIIVVAATNRPQALDPALLRPGRLEVHVHIPLPDVSGREEILGVHCRHTPLAPDVDLGALAEATPGFSGAELEGLCREAAMAALREDINGCSTVTSAHFAAALRTMTAHQARGARKV